MSVRVMAWVWHQSTAPTTARIVLLAIADAANDEGAEAYPSLATLVRKTRLSERAVQTALKTLVDLGELVVFRNAGPKGCNRYRIVMRTPAPPAPPHLLHPPAPDTGAAGAPPHVVHSTPAPDAPLPPQDVHPNHPLPVLEPKDPSGPSRRGTRIPADFAATADMIAWARENTPDVGTKETEAFVDYWRSKPGAAGTKVDWIATWRNWMRRAQQDSRRGNGRVRGFVERDGRTLKVETAAHLDLYQRMQALDEQESKPRQSIEGGRS